MRVCGRQLLDGSAVENKKCKDLPEMFCSAKKNLVIIISPILFRNWIGLNSNNVKNRRWNLYVIIALQLFHIYIPPHGLDIYNIQKGTKIYVQYVPK